MEIRQLEHFIAVASEMSFSKAAARAHVVQSALSMSVSKLEKELGVELFDRSRQQIRITPAGELFREHARQVIHSARLAKDAMSDFRGALSGTVEIGALVSFGPLDLPKVLGDFRRMYPFVRIRVRHSPAGSSPYLSAIADGSLDLALVSSPDRFPARIDMRLLSREPMMFVCRQDHHLADRNHVRIRDLAGEDLIGFPSEWGLQRLIDNAFAAEGIEAHVPYEMAVDYSIAADLVRNGLGTTFMPATDAARVPDLRVIAPRPAVEWQIYLASLGPKYAGPATVRLAELLLESAALT